MKSLKHFLLFWVCVVPCLLQAQTTTDYKTKLDQYVRSFEQAHTLQEKRVYMKKIYMCYYGEAIHAVPDYVFQQFTVVYQQVTQNKQLAQLLPLATVMWAQRCRVSATPAEGVELYFQALELAKQYNDKEVIFDATYSIASDFVKLSKYKEALVHFLAVDELIADPTLKDYMQELGKEKLPNMYCVIAQIYLELLEKPDFVRAEVYYKKAVQCAKETNNETWIGLSYGNMSKLYLLQNNLEKWRECLLFDVKHSLLSTNYGSAVGAYMALVRTYTKRKEYNEAKVFIDSLERLVTAPYPPSKFHILVDTARIYQELYHFYRATKQFEKAVDANDKYLEVLKRKNEANHKKAFEEIQTKYKVKFKEQEIATLQRQKITERWILYLVVMVAISVIAFAYVLFKHNRRQAKTNALLREQREELNTQKEFLALQTQALETTNQTKDQLFAILGHDLRSPIGSLEGMLNLMNMGLVSYEEFQNFIPKFHKNVKNMQDTLENLLQWSVSQMQGMKANPSHIHVSEIIGEKVQLFTEVAKSKNITISTEVDADVVAWADKDHVRLLLRNLINNALKFTPSEGHIKVLAYLQEAQVVVSVVDTGVGMSEEQVGKLFKKSQAFTTYGTEGEKGTGLGLQLCQEIVAKNNGNIWASSEQGKGSTFSFSLPTQA